MSHFQAIIFDFDGVIANSEPLHLNAFQDALALEGITLTSEEYYQRYLGYDDVGLLQALVRDRDMRVGSRYITDMVTLKGDMLQRMLSTGEVLFPGAAEFVRQAAKHAPIAIASGAMRNEILEILDGANLRSLFSVIVAAGDTPQSKPSPAPYNLAFERLQQVTNLDLDRWRCVAIEDSRWGLESAQGAGLRRIAVTTSYQAHELGDSPELVVSGLDALTIEMIDELARTYADGSR